MRITVLHVALQAHWFTVMDALEHFISGVSIRRWRRTTFQMLKRDGFAQNAQCARSVAYRVVVHLLITSQKPGRKPAPSLMSSLLDKLQTTIPSEFQLPDDIRNFFKDGGQSHSL